MKRKLGFRRLFRKTSLNCLLEESSLRLTNMKWLYMTNMEWLWNTVTANEINGRCQLDDFWQMFVFLREGSLRPFLIYLFLSTMFLYLRGEQSSTNIKMKLTSYFGEKKETPNILGVMLLLCTARCISLRLFFHL